MHHQQFATTTTGLRRDALPMRLFEKAKRLGIWNPSDIDFGRDQADFIDYAVTQFQHRLTWLERARDGASAEALDLES